MSKPSIELKLKTLPSSPGVYQFYDKDEKILYVGKAKNLKKRVSSYFNKNHDSGKTRVLVKKIVDIRHIVVPTETDALLLENNLIKKLQPRYNVLLKDDKTYPWICIKNEVVFIPLLAYDKNGNRIGYGKGFYDRFLDKCSTETIKIGLSFFDQEQHIIDVSENDVKLNYCVTPKKIYCYN